MNRLHVVAAALAAVLCLLCAGPPARADASGSSEWAAQGTSTHSDPDFAAGVAAVQHKDWTETLARMNAVVTRDPKNADAWNYLGFAYRNLGRMDESFKNYEQALRLDPGHRGAHEYMGEAYLQVGDLASAEEHLKALDRLCRLPCDEYQHLKAKVDAYRRAHPG